MHPPGYHHSEEARQRCWGCNGSGMLDITPADEEKARRLIAEGWMSTSNKYRSIARVHVPKAEDAFTFAADVPEWLRKEIMLRYDDWVRWHARGNQPEVEKMELSIGEFRAFKKLGGRMA